MIGYWAQEIGIYVQLLVSKIQVYRPKPIKSLFFSHLKVEEKQVILTWYDSSIVIRDLGFFIFLLYHLWAW